MPKSTTSQRLSRIEDALKVIDAQLTELHRLALLAAETEQQRDASRLKSATPPTTLGRRVKQ